jgi:hypothetical protein
LESQGDLILPPPGSSHSDRWDPTLIGRNYLLTLTTFGTGAVAVNPTSPDGYYTNGTRVILTATAGSKLIHVDV